MIFCAFVLFLRVRSFHDMVEDNYGRDELTLYAKPQSRAVSMFIHSAIFPSLLATLMKSDDRDLWTIVLDQFQAHTKCFAPLALYGEMERWFAQQEMNQLFEVLLTLRTMACPVLTQIARSFFEKLPSTRQPLKFSRAPKSAA